MACPVTLTPGMIYWRQPGRIPRLIEAWNVEGLTSGQIAAEFGVSRSAIMAKVRRLNLNARPQKKKAEGPRVRKPKPSYYARPFLKSPTLVPDTFKPQPAILQPPLRKPFPRRSLSQCAWICDEGLEATCCGHPVIEGQSWCEGHYAVVFTKPRDRAVTDIERQKRRAALRVNLGRAAA